MRTVASDKRETVAPLSSKKRIAWLIGDVQADVPAFAIWCTQRQQFFVRAIFNAELANFLLALRFPCGAGLANGFKMRFFMAFVARLVVRGAKFPSRLMPSPAVFATAYLWRLNDGLT